ncbi:hypothetical protein MycrhDRAFT_0958 [Mycolicibacterium rhodesiae JS60]|nr:hypothetical protein MycrhDRAFT_0958 [Mycolicibacterium rhodesiae JS60]
MRGLCQRIAALTLAVALPVAGLVAAGPATAGEVVTYEIVSDSIPIVDIEYVDGTGRTLIQGVPLPWRRDVALADATGPTGPGAQLRADWRRIRGAARWVTVRIIEDGKVLCQSTLDVGNATCYGNTPHVS